MTSGKSGQLTVEILSTGPGDRYVRAPLSLGRILHVDPTIPNAHVIYIRATGGGLAQGDRNDVEISVCAGAHAVVTSQAATRIHSMDHGYASQDTELIVDSGGVLEYLPDPIIPSRDCRFKQRTTVRANKGATAIIGDCFTAGRVAHGEMHDAAEIDLRTELHMEDNERSAAPTYIERACYRGHCDLASPIAHGNFRAWANLWVVCAGESAEKVLSSWRNYPDTCHVGASCLPDDVGCWARFMGDSIEQVKQLQHEYWDRARRIILGAPAFSLRKM
ncbi:urease accessory protein UreD [Corynebacterium lactis]|uniref:Urease accessory protein UreD n=1 Tax=Corynebacterium lactis RW2-5 TaxID=1408189 RepID=A0A0K2GYB0_9CORY|nr:urease accessory protein UreD [Corynebacterium lactis]ALA66683.1 urease accessory protein UreD [Corynebacterium lactis RW2-5]